MAIAVPLSFALVRMHRPEHPGLSKSLSAGPCNPDGMGAIFRRWRKGLFLGLSLSVLLLVSTSCSRQHDLMEEGEEYLASGDIDRAMERFELASRLSDSAESQAGVGVVLSLRRITAVTGLTMLEKSLDRRFDLDVLGRLFTLYLDMGLIQRASESIAATRIGEDRYFLPEVEVLRKTLQCLNATNDVDGKSIRSVEVERESYLSIRRSYAARCDVERLRRMVVRYYPYQLYRGRGNPTEEVFDPALFFLLEDPAGQKFEEGQAAWKEILDLKEITRCELQKIYGIPGELLNTKPGECKKYPASLVLLRESPPRLSESDFFHFPDKLFDDSKFYPEFHPLPEYYYPGEPNEDRDPEDI
ncbi:MAG: hypothetical protein KDK25_00140 [Leptospiraceae bacterium]|nr:hypothetical protein [Leptospiraceae bacterium]